MSKNNFEWVKFYKEFAKKLCHFKYMRDKLIEKIVDIYKNIDIKMPTLELKNDLVDIDPFTVFGLFNKTSMKEENRIKIINAFAKSFDIKSKVPTSFNSIPVLNNQNATFYYFVDDRNDRDIDDLWDFFESALNYSEEQSDENKNEFSKWFNIVINKKGNGNGKITMGLFWINPDLYFNLDSRNVWFVYESGKLPKELVNSLPKVEKKISAESYFEIADIIKKHLDSGDLPFKDFKELSYEAWRYSTEVNENNKEDKKISNRNTKNTTLLDDADTIHYWLYAPGRNAVKWDEFYNEGIMAIGWDEIGDLSNYDTQSQMIKAMKNSYDPNRSYKNNSYATWQFANEMKPGDIVFAKKGLHQIVGYGIVDSDYMFNDSRNEYKNIRKVNWIHKGEWEHPGQAVLKTLTDITPYTEYVENLIELVKGDSDDESDEMEVSYSIYNKEMFLADVYN